MTMTSLLRNNKFWVIDETDEEFGPFTTVEEAYTAMLTYLDMTEAEYQSNYTAQELVYIYKEEKNHAVDERIRITVPKVRVLSHSNQS